jgi:transposase-like protein
MAGRPRTYSEEDRAHAVSIYVCQGLAEAHKQTGVNKNTIRGWASDAGQLVPSVDPSTIEATKARQVTHQERREMLRDQAGDLAAEAFVTAKALLPVDPGLAVAAATVGGIAVDKMNVLDGGGQVPASKIHDVDSRLVEARQRARTLTSVPDVG